MAGVVACFFRKFDPMKEFSNIFKLVSYILSIPGSNNSVQRVFSVMNNKWSGSGNMCSQNLIRCELQITLNFVHNYKDFC
jgi:hypothetical protein